MQHHNESLLTEVLKLFKPLAWICIKDNKNCRNLYYGNLCDLDIDKLHLNGFVVDSFDVINDWFIVDGHYKENNKD